MFAKAVVLFAIVGLLQTQVCIAISAVDILKAVPFFNEEPELTCDQIIQRLMTSLTTKLPEFKGAVTPGKIFLELLAAAYCVGKPGLIDCVKQNIAPIVEDSNIETTEKYYDVLINEVIKDFGQSIITCSEKQDS